MAGFVVTIGTNVAYVIANKLYLVRSKCEALFLELAAENAKFGLNVSSKHLTRQNKIVAKCVFS